MLRISKSLFSWLLVVSAVCLGAAEVGGYGLAAAQEASKDGIRYTVTVERPATHRIDIELSLTPKQTGDLELFLPVWTPGSYLVREYARHIDFVTATDASGKAFDVEKQTKNRWMVKSVTDSPITVRYGLYCNELSVRTNFVDSEFAILNGAATFLSSREWQGQPHTVEFRLPKEWRQVVTSLEHPLNERAHVYRAKNYDELVDSPALLGNPSIHPFRVGDAEHLLVNQGGDGFWNGDAAAADAAKIVAEHQKMWGTVPYRNYIFFNLIAEGNGGLEHDNGTVLLTSRWHYRNERNYKTWLGLVSHEFFHAWNVRRLRPKALVNYDYESENYFDELWVAEGITSYYDDLAVARSGLISLPEYLAALSKQVETLQTMPGRNKQSLKESSHDAWIKYYRPDENSLNSSINYYNKGAIAGFLLDVAIRKRTNNEKSLDDLMRLLYTRYANQAGYTNSDLAALAQELTGENMEDWFEKVIDSRSELSYDEALDWLGLQFRSASRPSAQRGAISSNDARGKSSETRSTSTDVSETPWIGIQTEVKEGRLNISRVPEETPGFAAGLNVGDEVIAVDGYRLSEPLDDRLKQFSARSKITILVSRRGKLMDIPVTLQPRPILSWNLEVMPKPSSKQQESLRSWLHLPVPKSAK